MFTHLVEKAKANANANAGSVKSSGIRRSPLVGHQSSGAVEHALLLQRTVGNQAMLRLFAQQPRSHEKESGPVDREPASGVAWDFTNIPVFPPELISQNQAQSPFATPPLQPKLAIGAVNDPSEHEADAVAEQVMRMPDPGRSESCPACSAGQPCPECGGSQPQRKAPAVEIRVGNGSHGLDQDHSDGSGQQLDPAARAFFEPRFGLNFGRVRLHADRRAAESARSVNALAYTVGNHIAFDSNQYASHSDAGRRLLAHELVHTIQQADRSSPVAGLLQRQARPEEGGKKSETKNFTGTQPLILKAESDAVVILNAQGQPETVPMRAFGSASWEPGNPANPAVARANEAYRKARVEILTEAGRRPTVTFEGWNCDDEQKRVLRADLELAAKMVNLTLDKLNLSRAGAERGLKQLEFHFKTRKPEDLNAIIANFSRVREELGNVTDFSCGGLVCTIIRHTLAWSWKSSGAAGQIKICKEYWDLSTFERVLTIIHEATHKAFGTGDAAYEDEALKLPREKALDNADSYGNFAMGKFNDQIK